MKKTHPKTSNQFVTSLTHLAELIKQGHTDYAIVLAGGIGIFSRKTIKYSERTKRFNIINHIDESKQNLSAQQLLNEKYTLIGKAIPLNCLIAIIE